MGLPYLCPVVGRVCLPHLCQPSAGAPGTNTLRRPGSLHGGTCLPAGEKAAAQGRSSPGWPVGTQPGLLRLLGGPTVTQACCPSERGARGSSSGALTPQPGLCAQLSVPGSNVFPFLPSLPSVSFSDSCPAHLGLPSRCSHISWGLCGQAVPASPPG